MRNATRSVGTGRNVLPGSITTPLGDRFREERDIVAAVGSLDPDREAALRIGK